MGRFFDRSCVAFSCNVIFVCSVGVFLLLLFSGNATADKPETASKPVSVLTGKISVAKSPASPSKAKSKPPAKAKVMPLAPAVALAPIDGSHDCPEGMACGGTECDPGNVSMRSDADPETQATVSGVSLYNGSQYTTATDLYVSGVVPFALTRNHSGVVFNEFNQVIGEARAGANWGSDTVGPYFVEDEDNDDIILVVSTNSTIKFSAETGGGYSCPSCVKADLQEVGDSLIVTFPTSGQILEFHGFGNGVDLAVRGRLESMTTQAQEYATSAQGNVSKGLANPPGARVKMAYNPNGTVSRVTTPEMWQVDYKYDSLTGLVTEVSVHDGCVGDAGVTVQEKVEYIYFDDVQPLNHSLGMTGDLVQVKTSTKLPGDGPSEFSIVRVTHYRYYNDNSSEGSPHQIKAVYSDAELQILLEAGASLGDVNNDGVTNFLDITPFINLLSSGQYQANGDVNQDGQVNFLDTSVFISLLSGSVSYSTNNILRAGDLTHFNGSPILEHAGQRTTYYTSDEVTSSMKTPWSATEDLNTTFGGSDHAGVFNEDAGQGRVKSRTIGSGGCGGCGSGGGSGVTQYFYYLESPQAGQTIVVVDNEDGNGTGVYRVVRTLNENGIEIRKAKIHYNQGDLTDWKAWCTSKILDAGGRVIQTRDETAHSIVTNIGLLRQFLNPDAAQNDSATLEDHKGIITIYKREYAPQASNTPIVPYAGDGRITGVLLKNGELGNAHYISATDWENKGTGDIENYVPVATYTYPDATVTRSDGVKTQLSYDFWGNSDGLVMKSVTQTKAPVLSSENGSGVPTVTKKFYDKRERLRWAQNGEGYITYYAHHPVFSKTALVVRDVDPDSLPAVVTTGESDIDSYTVDGANGNIPDRDTDFDLPDATARIIKTYYDDQERNYKVIDADNLESFVTYKDREMIGFPNFDGTKCQSPISITREDLQGNVTEVIQLRATFDTIAIDGGIPTGFTTPPTQDDYISWTRSFYSGDGERLVKTLTYHNIPPEGDEGTIDVNYHVTALQYDSQNRVTHHVQTVTATNHQIMKTVYDWQGRTVESYSGTDSSGLDTSPNNILGTLSDSNLTLISTNEYDDGGVGPGRLTSSKRCYGSLTNNEFIETRPQYTWRGFARGSIQKNGSTEFGPWKVRDVDWLGRTVRSASYETVPDWNVVKSDVDYNTATRARKINLSETKYDVLGRAYQRLTYPGESTDAHFLSNTYYDRNNRVVCTGQANGTYREIAYDGLGRSYQSRTILNINSSKYSGGKFNYCEPEPHPDFASMSNEGNVDEGVITMSHTQYAGGDAVARYSVDMNHDDNDGFSLAGGNVTGGIRTSTYLWYNDIKQVTTVANYGAGNGTDTTDTWKHSDFLANFPAEPDLSDSTNPTYLKVLNDYIKVQKYLYNEKTTRQEAVTTALRDDNGALETKTDKTFVDDIGRILFTVENWKSSPAYDPTVQIESVVGKNRTVGMTYNGLSRETKKTAYDDGGDQETIYLYNDTVSASRVTEVIYPDSSDTDDSGTDQVKTTYYVDGSIKTMTDQRGVEHTYYYNERRQQELDSVTSWGTEVDSSIQSIGRSYDDRGRIEFVTSYEGTDDTSPVKNQVQYTYLANGRLGKSTQAHSGSVAASGGEDTTYEYDSLTDGDDVYINALRHWKTNYPGVTNAFSSLSYADVGSLTNFDRLNRPSEIQFDDGNLGNRTHSIDYLYSGAGSVVKLASSSGIEKSDFDDGNLNDYLAMDRYGRNVADRWVRPIGDHDSFAYDYDLAGNLYKRENLLNTVQKREYFYDDLLQLTKSKEENNSSYDRFFSRDQVGNLLGVYQGDSASSTQLRVHDFNDANELTDAGINTSTTNQTISHDEVGNMVDVPKPKQMGSSFTAKYDAWNRLVSLNEGTTTKASYQYDGLNRRIIRDEDGTKKEFYYNESNQVLTETDENGGNQAIYQYWGHYIDAVAVRITASAQHVFTHDNQFSVTAAFNVDTGAVDERYKYSPYGETTVLNYDFTTKVVNASTIDNEYTYTGRRLDPVTGLMYFRARYYHPGLGQFISRDPLGYVDGMSQYRGYFVPGAVDPWGLDVWGTEQWVWPWDPKASWDPRDTASLWSGRVYWYGGAACQGAGQGACNIGNNIKNTGQEVGCQAIDIGGCTVESLSYLGPESIHYRHTDWSGACQSLTSGDVSVGGYYGEFTLQVGSFGTYGQGKATIDWVNGDISDDEYSGIMGGTGVFQLAGARARQQCLRPKLKGPSNETALSHNAISRACQNPLLRACVEQAKTTKNGRCVEAARSQNGIQVSRSGGEWPANIIRPDGARSCGMIRAAGAAREGILPVEVTNGGIIPRPFAGTPPVPKGLAFKPRCGGCQATVNANPWMQSQPAFKPVTIIESCGSSGLVTPGQSGGTP